MDLRNLFCWRSNVSNDDIISERRGLKTGVTNDIFLIYNRIRIWGTGRYTPTKKFQWYSPPPLSTPPSC